MAGSVSTPGAVAAGSVSTTGNVTANDVILTGADLRKASSQDGEPLRPRDRPRHQRVGHSGREQPGLRQEGGGRGLWRRARVRPGIVMDRARKETGDWSVHAEESRVPVALVGKVYCKVDASYGPIRVGDLLTTSPTPGHAMTVGDQSMAFGAVIGKALARWVRERAWFQSWSPSNESPGSRKRAAARHGRCLT